MIGDNVIQASCDGDGRAEAHRLPARLSGCGGEGRGGQQGSVRPPEMADADVRVAGVAGGAVVFEFGDQAVTIGREAHAEFDRSVVHDRCTDRGRRVEHADRLGHGRGGFIDHVVDGDRDSLRDRGPAVGRPDDEVVDVVAIGVAGLFEVRRSDEAESACGGVDTEPCRVRAACDGVGDGVAIGVRRCDGSDRSLVLVDGKAGA